MAETFAFFDDLKPRAVLAFLVGYNAFERQREFRGLEAPEVLLSGNHAEIERWRAREAERLTRERRPDLIESKGAKR